MPNWLDGNMGSVNVLGYGDDTAQVTPKEVVEKMIGACEDVEVVLGECTGVVSTDDGNTSETNQKVTGVKYIPQNEDDESVLDADVVVVSAGPWSCAAEDWFDNMVDLPMEGVKSTSIVWKKGEGDDTVVDGTALFCGEDPRFGTHCKCFFICKKRSFLFIYFVYIVDFENVMTIPKLKLIHFINMIF